MKPSNPSKLILPHIGPRDLRVVGTSIKQDASYYLKATKVTGSIKLYQPDKKSTADVDSCHQAQSSYSNHTLPIIIEEEQEV